MSAHTTMTSLADLLALAARPGAVVCSHSGRVGAGDIFVSLPRAVPVGRDGPDFSGAAGHLAQAVRAGAGAVVATPAVWAEARRDVESALGAPLTVALVPDPRTAIGALARARYGTRDDAPALYAVTGTNGKTTSTYLLEAIFRAAGRVPGVIGTIACRWPGHEEASPLTTPDPLTTHAMLAAMRGAGADAALMEVSSHAIEQERLAGLAFAGALFTNLTQDHLDYHGDMEAYFSVKARLFAPGSPFLARGAALAANADDPYGARLLAANPAVFGYGFTLREKALLHGEVLAQSREGLHLRMRHAGAVWELFSPLVGEFNAANLLGVQALALAAGLGRDSFAALQTFAGVPGRLERISTEGDCGVFVDYAHTPDALEKALRALRGANFTRIVTVFGCGGNRDATKRPLMGRVAAALSDVVVLTSDNPRKEDPLAIMADVLPGLAGAKKIIEEVDRKKAIGLALNEVTPGTALLIAGKGHEPYQIIGETKLPFSDREVAREYLGCV